ncbi:phage holin family protein [Planctomicrobium sp. SH527]|uniref:phage holin family protein n=1 Tax=Planctomicrobium sp. SH527 TaxID=3448123 RepID=UPI003F5C4EAF
MDQKQSGIGDQPGVGGRNRIGTPFEEKTVADSIPPNAYSKVRSGATGILKDVLRLTDLQLQLLSIDLTEFWQIGKVGAVGACVSLVILLASLTVMLFGVADIVENYSGLSGDMAKLIVSGAAFVLGTGILLGSVNRLTVAGSKLQRSQAEFRENLVWLRSILSKDDE